MPNGDPDGYRRDYVAGKGPLAEAHKADGTWPRPGPAGVGRWTERLRELADESPNILAALDKAHERNVELERRVKTMADEREEEQHAFALERAKLLDERAKLQDEQAEQREDEQRAFALERAKLLEDQAKLQEEHDERREEEQAALAREREVLREGLREEQAKLVERATRIAQREEEQAALARERDRLAEEEGRLQAEVKRLTESLDDLRSQQAPDEQAMHREIESLHEHLLDSERTLEKERRHREEVEQELANVRRDLREHEVAVALQAERITDLETLKAPSPRDQQRPVRTRL